MAKTVVVYHSGYGHTQFIAQAVAKGAQAQLVAIDADGQVSESDWAALDAADAIVMGSPTYMGNVSWQFKKFADASSKRWFTRAWQDTGGCGSAWGCPRPTPAPPPATTSTTWVARSVCWCRRPRMPVPTRSRRVMWTPPPGLASGWPLWPPKRAAESAASARTRGSRAAPCPWCGGGQAQRQCTC
jgi:Flavodoxin domain